MLRTDGSVFLTNTTVCEGSRALQKPIEVDYAGPTVVSDKYHAANSIFDLLCLLDAAVLYDRIYCHPGTFPSDVATLKLRESLISGGVIEQVPSEVDFGSVGRALLAALSKVEGYEVRYGEDAGFPLSFSDYENYVAADLGLNEAMEDPGLREGLPPGDGRLGYFFALERFSGDRAFNGTSSFKDAAHRLLGIIQSEATGSYQAAESDLRAMYYVFMAEHLRVPYWPSTFFQQMGSDFPNYFRSSTRARIYERLAKALGSATDTIASEFDESYLYIPPFSAIILDRAAEPQDIPAELMGLRREYEGFRIKMLRLECERKEAKTIDSRLKVLGQVERLCQEVSKSFASPSRMSIETSLKYLPDVASLAANPSNPAAWSKMILQKPVEWLLEWYYNRPVNKLVRTARQVASLTSYGDLLTKHFGSGGTEAVQYVLSPRK